MNRFFLAVIVANTIILIVGLMNHEWEHHLESIHNLFLAVFVFELCWRWFRQRERGGWIAFDGIVVALALLPIAGGVGLLRVARLARVTHAMRHVGHFRIAHLAQTVRGTQPTHP